MKKILLLIAMFIMTIGVAQMKPCKIVFKSGEEVKAIGKIDIDDFKYKSPNEKKKIKIHFSEIEYVVIKFDEVERTYRFLLDDYTNKYKVLEEVVVGRISLYVTSMTSVYMEAEPSLSGVSYSLDDTSRNMVYDYYLKKINEDFVVYVGYSKSFSKRFKKSAAEYFSDCSELVSKIESKEFRKIDLPQIVAYYNDECK